jgi:hypothetical protein
MKQFFVLFLSMYLLHTLLYAQAETQTQEPATLKNLRSSTWTVTRIVTTDGKDGSKASEHTFDEGKHVIAFDEHGNYFAKHFLGKDSLQGAIIETETVIVLSDSASRTYFMVFEKHKQRADELTWVFVPFRKEDKAIRLTLKPYKTVNFFPPAYVNLEGEWEWSALQGRERVQINMELKQIGSRLLGEHSIGADKRSLYTLEGTVKGNIAQVDIKDAEEKVIGKATLKLLKEENLLYWQVLPNEDGTENKNVNTYNKSNLSRKGEAQSTTASRQP